jgi:hypothetical protein
MTKNLLAIASFALTTGLIPVLAPVQSAAAPAAHAARVTDGFSRGQIQAPRPPNLFFEVYPSPDQMLINLINNPPTCDCSPFALGMNYGSIIKVLGNPTTLRGNTAVWISTTEVAGNNLKIGSKERLTVTLDVNGNVTGFQSTFAQSELP